MYPADGLTNPATPRFIARRSRCGETPSGRRAESATFLGIDGHEERWVNGAGTVRVAPGELCALILTLEAGTG